MATFVFCFLVGTANRLNLTLLGFGFARLGCLAAQIELLSRNFLSLTLAPRIAASSSKNAAQLFIGAHNETLSVVAMRVCNPDRLRSAFTIRLAP